MIRADLLRRGINQNNVPMRQLFDYINNWDDMLSLESPFTVGDK